MATSLLHLPYKILKRNPSQFTRITVTVCADRCRKIRQFHTQTQKSGSNKILTNLLTYSILFSGLSYLLYKWKNAVRGRLNDLAFVPSVHAKTNQTDISNNRNKYNFIADVVEMSVPAVVQIQVNSRHLLRDIRSGSAGSGFIVGEDGLILTNAHVVFNPNKLENVIKVHLHDGSVHNGVVEYVDLYRDLATIRINKTNLPVMKFGNSADLRPGEFVIAIGSPLSLSNTITSGVVSSVKRQAKDVGFRDKQMDYIQTDAAITYGNSGGPLVNLNGEVIGINSMKVTSGISFAIPIEYAETFLKEAKAHKKAKEAKGTPDTRKPMKSYAYLGISMSTLTPDVLLIMQHRGEVPFSIRAGVFVHSVMDKTPAYRAGILPGDIITHVDDKPLLNTNQLYQLLSNAPEELTMIIYRHGVIKRIFVKPEKIEV